MLEEIVKAVDQARIAFLTRQLQEEARFKASEPARIVEIFPEGEDPKFIEIERERRKPEVLQVTYVSEYEEESLTYVFGKTDYLSTESYLKRDLFYVHVPSWASIKSADQQHLGDHVLGTANISNGQIRLLESLNPQERTEVLLHETLHLLYPMHSEGDIRNMVRSILGKQYCLFH